jgi:uncharacterized protein YecE (DUF72 family)
MTQLRIGISGWNYHDWHGRFYPKDLSKAAELQYSSHRFNSIELNGSFYSLKTPENYRAWYEQTPPGFVLAVKGSRFITHNKKLRDVETPLANFFASGVLLLKEKLGPFVWQLPENFKFDAKRVGDFLALLPRDTQEAARLAGRHDSRVKGESWTIAPGRRLLRHAIEIRNETFLDADFVRLMRRAGAAIVFADSADWPYTEELTAGFAYLRLHGHKKTYASRYGAESLRVWMGRIRQWRDGSEPDDAARITSLVPPRRKNRDVYVYFDNDQKAYAPQDALCLAEMISPQPSPVLTVK